METLDTETHPPGATPPPETHPPSPQMVTSLISEDLNLGDKNEKATPHSLIEGGYRRGNGGVVKKKSVVTEKKLFKGSSSRLGEMMREYGRRHGGLWPYF